MADELADAVDALTREVVFRSKCAEAIEATARELGVDPAALAEAARDGKFLALGLLLLKEGNDRRGQQELYDEWVRRMSEVLDKLAALRAGKGGD